MRPYLQIMQQRAAESLARQINVGSELYEKRKHLRRLLPLAPEDFADESRQTTRAILLHLARALRAERGRAGHWTYDLNRHIALAQAYKAEKERLSGGARSSHQPVSSDKSQSCSS